ncbi:MAG TPA: hypothetical protein VMA35_12560 [Candidatus Sulfopaludibacter sp.]|nr:hypothetical protein [Candidatus Sulfopaludibacter sp.]
MKITSLTVTVVLVLVGCARSDRLAGQPAQAVAQIQHWVPVGTPLAQAQRIMERHHFACSAKTNSSFGDWKAAGFLYCERRDTDRQVTPMVTRHWQVALILADGKVSAVRVTMELMGP